MRAQVRYIGVSNETSYGVMRFVQAAEQLGLPRIVSIQNSYSLLVRTAFETDLAEACAPRQADVGLLAYSPLAGAQTAPRLSWHAGRGLSARRRGWAGVPSVSVWLLGDLL
jgi:aryl-alcohol dehydrogenase-like predicted oxidoreductase